MLRIEDLHVRVDDRSILNGLNLNVGAGEVHAIMGPNGSGKSTLAQVIAGRKDYEVVKGSISFLGQDLLSMAPEERAKAGLFLGFQYPTEIPGVNNTYLLKAALNAQRAARVQRDRLHACHARQVGQHAIGRARLQRVSGGPRRRLVVEDEGVAGSQVREATPQGP